MDYTPGIFVMDVEKINPANRSHVNATLANQLALYVTLYSPLQMAADLPEHYEQRPDAFGFIERVAVDWAESRYLLAEPGEYVVVARRAKNGGQWFAGGVAGEKPYTAVFRTDFLEPGKRYEATIWADAPDADCVTNAEAYTVSTREVDATTELSIPMARGGGFAIEFRECR